MLANNVQESSSSTGTGNITVSGSSESGRTFSSQYRIGERFPYFIDDGAGNFETGIGYLSGSTTLVREFPQDGSSALPVNFGAGTKQVFVARSAQNSSLAPTAYGIIYPPFFISYTTSYTKRSTQLYFLPFQGEFKGAVSNWACYIKTASAGASIRMAIYQANPATGYPTGDPLCESDNIPCDSTGVVESPMANNTVNAKASIVLPDYFFIAVAFEDTTVQLASYSHTISGKAWVELNSNGAVQGIYQNYTMGAPTAGVAVLPTVGTISSRAESAPIVGFTS